MDHLKREQIPISSLNKQEPIIANDISSISFIQQQNNDFGLIDHKSIDHLIDAQEPIPFCTNEIFNEIHKILDFKYKWYKWQHIDLAKSNLSYLQDLKTKLNDIKRALDQNIENINKLKDIRQMSDNYRIVGSCNK